MRKNVKKQLALRVLSTAALMAMVSSIATAAFADTYDLNTGSVTVETRDDGITYVTQTDNSQVDGYARNENSEVLHEHPDTTGVTITSGGTQTSNTITVETAKDQTTNVTLDKVHIDQSAQGRSDSSPIVIKGAGDTNLELNGDNTAVACDDAKAGIQKSDSDGNGTLTIKDDDGVDGSLLASGGYGGAGIGGSSQQSTSNITITGGDISAYGGGGGAGIGSGEYGTGKNLRIEGDARVTASSRSGTGIGGSYCSGNSIVITDHAEVNAYGSGGAGIGDGNVYGSQGNETTIAISGNATVHAEGHDAACGIGSGHISSINETIIISDNANVTAVGSDSSSSPAIGSFYSRGNTTIQITGGTVNAVNGAKSGSNTPAIGSKSGPKKGSCTVTVNSSTGDTVVNAYVTGDDASCAIGSGTYGSDSYTPSANADYNKDGSSNLGKDNSAIINYYKNTSIASEKIQYPDSISQWGIPSDKDFQYRRTIANGTLTKVVHNRKYMEEHPEIVDTSKLENSDLHDWQLVGDVVEPTLEKEGYADYVCRIDNCGQTRHVVLPKLTPEESGSVEMREVGVIFWDAAAQAAPAALQGKVLSADEQTAMAAKAQVESLLADKANWKLAEDVGDLKIHPAADAAGTVYEQAVKASGCQYYVIANVTAQ